MSNETRSDTYSAAEVAMRNSGLWVRLEDHNFVVGQYIRKEAEADAARLRGVAAQPVAVAVAVAGDLEARAKALLSAAENEPASEYGFVHRGIAHRAIIAALSAAPAAPVSDEQFADADALIAYLDELKDDGGQGGEPWQPAQAAIAGIRAWQARAAPAPVAGDAVESIAIALWHRFAPDDRIEWEEETEKAIYRDAAQQVAALAQDRASQAGAAGALSARWHPIATAPSDERIICAWLGAPGCSEVGTACHFTDHKEGAPYWCSPDDRLERYGVPHLWQPFPTLSDDALDAALAQDRASQAGAAVPEGWRLVPVKATETMRNRGVARYQEFADEAAPYTAEGERQQMQAAYAAMLAAAPTPAAEGEVRRG